MLITHSSFLSMFERLNYFSNVLNTVVLGTRFDYQVCQVSVASTKASEIFS